MFLEMQDIDFAQIFVTFAQKHFLEDADASSAPIRHCLEYWVQVLFNFECTLSADRA